MRKVLSVLIAAALSAGAAITAAPRAVGAECPEEETHNDAVTSPSLAIPGFPDRRATTDEIIDYFRRVDEESERVSTATFAKSVNGQPLVYSFVATEENLERIDDIAERQQALRDPRTTTPAQAARLAGSNPAIVWYTGNVHGNEQSGGDAAISILYDLASRTDCGVAEMLDNLVIGIMPTQNPDGRDSFSRTNEYGFDMNRDWFARTQPETDGKLDLLSKYPPLLFIDAHEMFGSDFFFPPNADPIHHEISPQSVSWINDIYGKALAKEFDERRQSDPLNWDYFNYSVYDLFYMGYGDSVPTTGFTSAGMTFEKGIVDTDRQRWIEQFVAGMTSLQQASKHKDDLLRGYYDAHAEAVAQGRAGELERNQILQPENELRNQVPDLTVRHYFIPNTRAYADTARVIERLLKMDVEVYRLTRDLEVRDLQRYGRGPRAGTVRRGSYWIPMEQPQKRWIQAMLGENSYVPFPYFYDVTAWSNPLLMNLDASFSGARLSPAARRVTAAPRGRATGFRGATFLSFPGDTGRAVAAVLHLERKTVPVTRLDHAIRARGEKLRAGTFVVATSKEAKREKIKTKRAARRFGLRITGSRGAPPRGIAVDNPKIAVYEGVGESLGHLRWLLERDWRLRFSLLTGAQVAAGQLTSGDYDVFIVPGVVTGDLEPAREQIRSWIDGGGTYVGTARPGNTGGTPYAVSSGFTSSQTEAADYQIPGTVFRVTLDDSSPVTLGAPRSGYWYHLGEDVLTRSETGVNAATFPRGDADFWFSGFADGAAPLKGTAGLVDEKLGDGRVVLFSGEPNYRGYTEGISFLLANAIAYPKSVHAAGTDVTSRAAAAAVASAMESARPETGPGRPLRIEVAASQREETLEVLQRFDDEIDVTEARGSAFFEIANPEGLDVESHPFIHKLLPALSKAGVVVRTAIL